MKIRLCPKCGKQNDENAWNCADCGTTLSMNTIVDSNDVEVKKEELIHIHELADISPYFRDDYKELVGNIFKNGEKIIKGCDVAESSRYPPFEFGYVILLQEKLISASFLADVQPISLLPQRACIDSGGERLDTFLGINQRTVGPRTGPGNLRYAVDRLDAPLTDTEKSSRRLTSMQPKDLYSIDPVGGMNGNQLNFKIYDNDGKSIREDSFQFYFNDDASEIYEHLSGWLKHQGE